MKRPFMALLVVAAVWLLGGCAAVIAVAVRVPDTDREALVADNLRLLGEFTTFPGAARVAVLSESYGLPDEYVTHVIYRAPPEAAVGDIARHYRSQLWRQGWRRSSYQASRPATYTCSGLLGGESVCVDLEDVGRGHRFTIDVDRRG